MCLFHINRLTNKILSQFNKAINQFYCVDACIKRLLNLAIQTLLFFLSEIIHVGVELFHFDPVRKLRSAYEIAGLAATS